MLADPRSGAYLLVSGQPSPPRRRGWADVACAAAFAGALVAGIAASISHGCHAPEAETAYARALDLELATQMALLRGFGCPEDAHDLVSAGILTKARPDPWGNDYWFARCEGERTRVCSLGADGRPSTPDDICSNEER